ncbi:unnamed protein product [Meloidogyne enterolobii]|uniref:Uncharacterized protein n=1 Tax=Meloidogyne enterolobii TaxID=390850 RepID=A0ACB1A4H7_MELEN
MGQFQSAEADLRISPKRVVVNPSGDTEFLQRKLAFKIVCVNNIEYGFVPVHGFFKPGETTVIRISRSDGPAKTDYFQICLLDAKDEDHNAENLFGHSNYGMEQIKIFLEASSSVKEQLIASKEPPSPGD